MRFKIICAAVFVFVLQLTSQARQLDLRADCGAVGDGVADDSPAFALCLDKAGRREGTTINVPGGVFRLATPIRKNFSNLVTSLKISGEGSASKIIPATRDDGPALLLQNLESLIVEDLYFVGDAAVTNDAIQTLAIDTVYRATLRSVGFYGIIATSGGSIVHAANTDLLIEKCSFRGSTTHNAGVVHIKSLKGFVIRDSDFIDYGVIDGVQVSRTGHYGPLAWIQIDGGLPVRHADSQAPVEIRNVRMDEAGFYGLLVYTTDPASARIRAVQITNLSVNTQHQGAGVYISNAETVRITDSWFGFTLLPDNYAIILKSAGDVTIKGSRGVNGAQSVFADAATRSVTLQDSHFAILNIPANILTVVTNGRTVPRTAVFDLDRLRTN